VTVTQRVSATRTVKHQITIHADVTTFDAMNHVGQLCDREHRVAARLYGLFLAAGLGGSPVMRSEAISEGVDDMGAELAGGDPEQARMAYRRILRDSGGISGPILDALMHGQHPGWRLPDLQAALEWLGTEWGME